MTFAPINSLLVLGLIAFGTVVWMFMKNSPAPVRIQRNRNRRS